MILRSSADWPTCTVPFGWKATIEGMSLFPSLSASVVATPFFTAATTVLVVPRSIPTATPIRDSEYTRLGSEGPATDARKVRAPSLVLRCGALFGAVARHLALRFFVRKLEAVQAGVHATLREQLLVGSGLD